MPSVVPTIPASLVPMPMHTIGKTAATNNHAVQGALPSVAIITDNDGLSSGAHSGNSNPSASQKAPAHDNISPHRPEWFGALIIREINGNATSFPAVTHITPPELASQ